MADLARLVNSYYQKSVELANFLNQNAPLLTRGASVPQLDAMNTYINGASVALTEIHGAIHRALAPAGPHLDQEVTRYRYVLAMADAIGRGLNQRQDDEAKNALERWLINLANDKQSSDRDPIFSLQKLEDNYPPTIKLRSELQEKKIPSDRLSLVLQLGREYLGLKSYPKVRSCEITVEGVQVGEYKFPLPTERGVLLLTRAQGNNALVCTMIVRYACLLQRGQQWSIPTPVYRYFVEQHGVTIEGFASPINSRILTLNRADLNFCSLFPDTDAPFGSLGDFFQVDFTGKHIVANPPFVPAVMDRMLLKINESCRQAAAKGGYVRFFVIVPEWIKPPAEFYVGLMNSPYCVFDFQLPGGSYYYVDLSGARIAVKFHSHIFILSVNVEEDYSNLPTSLLRVYQQ